MDIAARIATLNDSQRAFLKLHAFGDPHRWAWKDVDWAARAAGGPRTGRLQANSDTAQATISAEDLDAIRDCWEADVFPNVRADIKAALLS